MEERLLLFFKKITGYILDHQRCIEMAMPSSELSSSRHIESIGYEDRHRWYDHQPVYDDYYHYENLKVSYELKGEKQIATFADVYSHKVLKRNSTVKIIFNRLSGKISMPEL